MTGLCAAVCRQKRRSTAEGGLVNDLVGGQASVATAARAGIVTI
jgi:hypothetical protein